MKQFPHILILLSLCAFRPTVQAAKYGSAPTTLDVSLSAFPNPNYTLKIRGRSLYYREYLVRLDATGAHGERIIKKKAKITPTPALWRAFRRELDALNVWRWRASYENDGVSDGIFWTFKVSYPAHSLDTGGSNNYPDETGAPGRDIDKTPFTIAPTPTFDRFLAAIQKLTGKYPFTLK